MSPKGVLLFIFNMSSALAFASLFMMMMNLNSVGANYRPDMMISPLELTQLELMRATISRMPPENFYNYHLMCSNAKSRVNLAARLVHKTIPSLYYDTILNTLHGSTSSSSGARRNRCPKWMTSSNTIPESGSMEYLALDERTPVGEVVYLLSAVDPERRPLFYFVRKAENEPDSSDDLFVVNQIKIGFNWYGEVRLARPLTTVPSNEITYLVNAFDGNNIAEQVAKIVVVREFPDEEVETISPLMESKIGDEKHSIQVELIDDHDDDDDENSQEQERQIESVDHNTQPELANDQPTPAVAANLSTDDVEAKSEVLASVQEKKATSGELVVEPTESHEFWVENLYRARDYLNSIDRVSSSMRWRAFDVFLLVFKCVVLSITLVLILFAFYLFFAF